MKNIAFSAALAAALVLSAANAAAAQDPSLGPNFGTATLRAGFQPDPHVVEVRAGGDRDASRMNGCAGMVSAAPDYRVAYTAGSGLALTFRVRSSADTTLVINGPDGRWSCNDDTGGSLNPGVTYRTPSSGQYDVWVGVFGSDTPSARLSITEME